MSNTFKLKKYKNIQVSVSLVKNEAIQDLNKQHLNRDYPTDVLSFNIDEEISSEEYYLGDIVVNIDKAEEQAATYSNNLEQEIAELVEHGMLHLLGVHHDGDDH
ncbi:MAG: rRNA maturation RNase YbeY [Patescibacteria group bacterium]